MQGPYAELVDQARRRSFVPPDVDDARDALRWVWARAEAGRREAKTEGGDRRVVRRALLDPFAPTPSVADLRAWAAGAPAEPELLPARVPDWPHAGLVLGPVLRGLRRNGALRPWLRTARWALELGHPDVARRWAAKAARKIEAIDEFVRVSLIQAEAFLAEGELRKAERLTDKALPMLHERDRRAAGRALMGRILAARGDVGRGERLLKQARTDARRAWRGPHRMTAGIEVELALAKVGREDSEELLDSAMAAYTALGLGESAVMARLLQVHGQALQHADKLALAHAAVQAGRRIQQRLWATERTPAALTTRHLLGGIAQAQGRRDEAQRCFEDNRALIDELFDGAHPLRAATLHQLAALRQAAGELAEATLLLRGALDEEATLFGGRDHPSTAITELSLGVVLLRQGRRDEGLKLLTHAEKVLRKRLGAEHPHSKHAAKLLTAAGGEVETDDRPNVITPFVLHALSAASLPVSRRRLAHLAFRQLLLERAGSLMPVLQAADLASARPGLLCRDPRALPAPPELADRLTVPWSELIAPVVEMHRQFTEGFDSLFPATRGRIDPRGMDLNPVGDHGSQCLVDDALAAAVAARKTGDRSDLRDELELWSRAAEIAIRTAPEGLGTTLPRLLIQLLPESREVLMERWGLE